MPDDSQENESIYDKKVGALVSIVAGKGKDFLIPW